MSFYDLDKKERAELVVKITDSIFFDIKKNKNISIIEYFSNEDTYIRKSAYIAIGRIYKSNENLKTRILGLLANLLKSENVS